MSIIAKMRKPNQKEPKSQMKRASLYDIRGVTSERRKGFTVEENKRKLVYVETSEQLPDFNHGYDSIEELDYFIDSVSDAYDEELKLRVGSRNKTKATMQIDFGFSAGDFGKFEPEIYTKIIKESMLEALGFEEKDFLGKIVLHTTNDEGIDKYDAHIQICTYDQDGKHTTKIKKGFLKNDLQYILSKKEEEYGLERYVGRVFKQPNYGEQKFEEETGGKKPRHYIASQLESVTQQIANKEISVEDGIKNLNEKDIYLKTFLIKDMQVNASKVCWEVDGKVHSFAMKEFINNQGPRKEITTDKFYKDYLMLGEETKHVFTNQNNVFDDINDKYNSAEKAKKYSENLTEVEIERLKEKSRQQAKRSVENHLKEFGDKYQKEGLESALKDINEFGVYAHTEFKGDQIKDIRFTTSKVDLANSFSYKNLREEAKEQVNKFKNEFEKNASQEDIEKLEDQNRVYEQVEIARNIENNKKTLKSLESKSGIFKHYEWLNNVFEDYEKYSHRRFKFKNTDYDPLSETDSKVSFKSKNATVVKAGVLRAIDKFNTSGTDEFYTADIKLSGSKEFKEEFYIQLKIMKLEKPEVFGNVNVNYKENAFNRKRIDKAVKDHFARKLANKKIRETLQYENPALIDVSNLDADTARRVFKILHMERVKKPEKFFNVEDIIGYSPRTKEEKKYQALCVKEGEAEQLEALTSAHKREILEKYGAKKYYDGFTGKIGSLKAYIQKHKQAQEEAIQQAREEHKANIATDRRGNPNVFKGNVGMNQKYAEHLHLMSAQDLKDQIMTPEKFEEYYNKKKKELDEYHKNKKKVKQ